MINNTQPVRLAYQSSMVGYTKGIFYHSSYTDQDVVGKAIWINDVLQPSATNLDYLYIPLQNLSEDTQYKLESAFFDSMVDSEILAARSMVSISDPLVFRTKVVPTITGHSVEAEQVDVGVTAPTLRLELSGDAESVEVQWSPTGLATWSTVYTGAMEDSILVSNIPTGDVDIRVRGIINIPDGLGTQDISAWDVLSDITIDWVFIPPSAPSNIDFQVAKLAEPAERYDVQVSWDWVRGSGAAIREFTLYQIPESIYTSNPANSKWAGATLISAGTAQTAVITNHPFEATMRYKVAAISWGPTGSSTTFSTSNTLVIDENTSIDNDFTTQTGVEVTYAHIKGLLNDGGTWKQTFLLDAATGAVSIGLLGSDGSAPISFNPSTGVVNVKGGVISETITAASYVLANLSGSDSPSFRSSTKQHYGHASEGIWMGHDTTDQYAFKFDLGNQTQYIRWDGDTLKIAGDVVIGTPNGDIPLSNGTSFTAFVYKSSVNTPAISGNSYPPSGWSKTPPVAPEGELVYVSTGDVFKADNELVDGTSWSSPIPFTGETPYFHTAYADTSTGVGFSFSPTDKEYMGTYVSSDPAASTTPGDYTWIKTKGDDGIPGEKGDDGVQLYTWIKYADTITGSGMSGNPSGKDYIGLAYNKTSSTASSNAGDYTWSLIKGADGDQGVKGDKGDDGIQLYTWIKYADTSSGSGMSDDPTGKDYIGLAYNKASGTESNTPGDYTWSLIRGEKGDDGSDGSTGDVGPRAPGFYSQSITNYTQFDSAAATALFVTLFGAGESPTVYDVVTQYDSATPGVVGKFESRMWDGSSWITSTQVIHGNAVIDGTLRAQSIVASEAFLQEVGANVIYNDDAFASGTPEDDYTMKIDLANGSIHIR